MYADFFPARELDDLAARYDNLWLYVDDAHSASWTGTHGRGYALEQLSPATLARTVVAASLNKSFAAAGGAITFPDAESRRLVASVGGPLIFSGPVQPPMLGAIVASARLHRSPEIVARQELLPVADPTVQPARRPRPASRSSRSPRRRSGSWAPASRRSPTGSPRGCATPGSS